MPPGVTRALGELGAVSGTGWGWREWPFCSCCGDPTVTLGMVPSGLGELPMPLNLALAGKVLPSTRAPQSWCSQHSLACQAFRAHLKCPVQPGTQGPLLTPNSYASTSDLFQGISCAPDWHAFSYLNNKKSIVAPGLPSTCRAPSLSSSPSSQVLVLSHFLWKSSQIPLD